MTGEIDGDEQIQFQILFTVIIYLQVKLVVLYHMK